MRIFLVDMENVPKLTNINKLATDDKLILFFSDNTAPMPMDTLKAIIDTGVSVEIKKIHLGTKNALDFQLSTYLGYLMHTYANAKFIIVSKDKGFEVVKKFWAAEKKKNIVIQNNISVQQKKG
jgi:hypothetical protein